MIRLGLITFPILLYRHEITKMFSSRKLLKIGIVCYPSIGGSGIVATNLGNELAKRGHQVHFISYEKPFLANLRLPNVYFHQVNINQYELFKYPDYTLPLAVTINEVQKRYRLDLLHVHYAVPHATAALMARRLMRQQHLPLAKIITTLHGTDITLLAKDPNLYSVIKYSIERSHGVTAVSKSLRRETIETLKTHKPIEVIYNFYNPKAISVSRQKIRQSLGIKAGDFVALHMSNLRLVKRVEDLLKITAKLKNRPRFKLLILAGSSFDRFRPLVKKLGIQKQVVIKDKVRDIENYINAADAGIYTSNNESFGMGILETMVYGRPVLATGVGGVPEVLRDGKDGFLYKVGDLPAFAKGLKTLMDNPLLLEKMGRSAQKRAYEKFCAEVIVQKYLNYYRKILGK